MIIQLAFYKGDGKIIDKLIKWWTKEPYSHVEIYFGNNLYFSADAWEGLVRLREFQANPNNWDYRDIEITETELEIIKSLCVANSGKGYDYIGVAAFVIPFLHNSRRKWFCSEICCSFFQAIGRFPNLIPQKTTPGMLMIAQL